MFSFTFVDGGKVLRNLLDITKDVIDEMTFCISDNGLEVQTMDKSLVCLIDLQIKPEALDGFICDQVHEISVMTKSLLKAMKIGWKHGACRWMFDEKSPDRMSMRFGSDTEFDILLINRDFERVSAPDDTTFAFKGYADSGKFSSAIKDMVEYGEVIQIDVDVQQDSQLIFKAEGDDGKVRMTLPFSKKPTDPSILDSDSDSEDEEDDISMTSDNMQLLYSANYMAIIAKGASLTDTMCIELDENCPSRFTFDNERSTVTFWLARKFTDD